jgi:hypothetical protein
MTGERAGFASTLSTPRTGSLPWPAVPTKSGGLAHRPITEGRTLSRSKDKELLGEEEKRKAEKGRRTETP